MHDTVTISNGQQFSRVNASELEDALRDGFYLPLDRGLTIVSNGRLTFEIPIDSLPSATESGFADLLANERKQQVTRPKLRRVTNIESPAAVSLPAVDQMNGFKVTDTTASPKKLAQIKVAETPQAATTGLAESDLLVTGLSQAEQEAEQAKQLRQQHLDETKGWQWYALFARMWMEERRISLMNHLRGSSISIMIHVAIVLLLASLALVQEQTPVGLFLSATPSTDDAMEEVMIEPTPLETTEPTESEESEAPPESEEMPMEMAESINAPNFLSNISGDAIAAPVAPAEDPSDGESMPKQVSKVFGTARTATDYVFVIDNSNSMTKGRFETALYELMMAINSLTPKQNFYVIFYSDTAYGLMHPNPVSKLVPATDRNKQAVNVWINTVPLCLQTNGKEAIELGFRLQPDVMYVLGDGAFTDKAGEIFAKKPRGKTIVHCRGMEVDAKKASGFEALAKAHGGNYKDVGVHPFAAELAKKNPRPRNSTRNGYWGLKLPVAKKKP